MRSIYFLLAALAIVPAAEAQAPATAFVNVSVVPMDSNHVLDDQTVVVREGRITDIGPAQKVKVPAGATRIDGRGKYLLPGLADMHAHVPGIGRAMALVDSLNGDRIRMLQERSFGPADSLEAERMLFLYLASGVTTVRIMHGMPEILDLRARAARGDLLGPRMYVGTPMITGLTPEAAAMLAQIMKPSLFNGIQTTDQARQVAEIAKAKGYDFIKLYGLVGAPLDTLVATARRLGIPVAGHVPDAGAAALDEAIRAGYRSIEHLTGFDRFVTDNQIADTSGLRTMAVRLREAHIWNCPTFMVIGRNLGYFDGDTLTHWPEIRYVSSATRQKWAAKPPSPGEAQKAARAMAIQREVVKMLHEAGAGLLLGTDASVPGILPGFSIARELEEMVKAGLTPYDALMTGTRNVASYFGTLDSTGTIARGKRADLVLLSGNPLDDIRHVAEPAGVMAAGRWLPRSELDRRLAALEGTLY